MTTQKTKKNDLNYCCEICDYNTCKKTDYLRHLHTQKHINNDLTTQKTKKIKEYIDFNNILYNFELKEKVVRRFFFQDFFQILKNGQK